MVETVKTVETTILMDECLTNTLMHMPISKCVAKRGGNCALSADVYTRPQILIAIFINS